jgi:hypothetical protein
MVVAAAADDEHERTVLVAVRYRVMPAHTRFTDHGSTYAGPGLLREIRAGFLFVPIFVIRSCE